MPAAVVCGVDGSRAARAGARLGAALARRLGLELELAHALDGGALTGSASGYLMRRSERPLIVCGTGGRRPAQVVAGRSASCRGSSRAGPSRRRCT
jgi:hypothetical protein